MPALRFKKLDVRPLLERGEEPRGAIEAALATLPAGHGLTVVAPFLPSPLIERLRGAGFLARAARRTDGSWRVDFWRD